MLRLLVTVLLLAPPVGMVTVPAGRFRMGSDYGEDDERPAHDVYLDDFAIDAHEVTAGEYGACVAAKKCAPPTGKVGGDDVPVTWVSWFDAEAYCRFVGKRLPTEAEWEKAARGTDGRRFPWGNDADCARANFGNYRGEGRCPNNPGKPVTVGSYAAGASPYGALDMAGNVWEWVADRYDATFYARSPARSPTGPREKGRDGRRVLRGGACCSMFGLPRVANRLAYPPEYRDDDIGFRCARDGK